MDSSTVRCTRCVMDTTDPEIEFDAEGVCNHCHAYDDNIRRYVFSGDDGRERLAKLVGEIQRAGRGREYDCVIGVSGGVDSTFVAYKVKELGLRPLAVHLDNGWDSELAVANIQKALERLRIELHTHVLDWEEFKDLQLAFLRASTPDSEIPSDHAIFALMYDVAHRRGIRYILSGINRRTESHLPRTWSQGHFDWAYIRGVHRQFGKRPLMSYPHMGLWRHEYLARRHHFVDILNYFDYRKLRAMEILQKELGWTYYGGKHFESIYTRFYQGYWLPRKFGFDKRKSHLSSLICAGEITRAQALEELARDTYPVEQQKEDVIYVCKKLGLSELELEEIMRLPAKRTSEYPSNEELRSAKPYRAVRAVYRAIRSIEARCLPGGDT